MKNLNINYLNFVSKVYKKQKYYVIILKKQN